MARLLVILVAACSGPIRARSGWVGYPRHRDRAWKHDVLFPADDMSASEFAAQPGVFWVAGFSSLKIPLAVFGRVVEANEVVFLLRGRPVLAPNIALIEYKSSVVDELFGMLVG